MSWLYYIPVVLVSYLIGCSSMALFIAKCRGVDIRNLGSGNLGASNAMITMGWKAGIIVGVHDIGKGLLAVLLARHFCGELPNVGAVAGVACVLGHIFPFYLKFKGGKGLAAFLGMTIALNWKFAIIVLLSVALITLVTDYIVMGTVTAAVTVPTYLGVAQHSLPLFLIILVATVVMIFKHRDNYRRLIAGTELGLRRANKGDYRGKPEKK